MDLIEASGVGGRRHPWELARASFFRRVLDQSGLLDKQRSVLDVGSGDGFVARTMLDALRAGSTVVCCDSNYTDDDLRNLAAPGREGLSFTRSLQSDRFDVITLLDVIEHVPDDREFLNGFVERNLAPDGFVLVSVPAWMSLFSRHDEALKHCRRYSPRQCRALLAGAGLTIRRSGGLFHSLLLPRAVATAGERFLTRLGRRPPPPPNLGEWRGGAALSALIGNALAVDNAISHGLSRLGLSLPGLSFWALCSR